MNASIAHRIDPYSLAPIWQQTSSYFRQFIYYKGVDSCKIGELFKEIIQSPYPHLIRTLHQQISIFQPFTEQDAKLKTVWEEFFKSFCLDQSIWENLGQLLPLSVSDCLVENQKQNLLSQLGSIYLNNLNHCGQGMGLFLSFFKDPRLEEFQDTDLVLYPENFPDSLVYLNGIKPSELQKAKDFYRFHFFNNQGRFILSGTDAYQEFMRKNIRWVLSRSMGRELIYEITKQMSKTSHFLIIEEGKDSHFLVENGSPLFYNIKIAVESIPVLHELPDGNLRRVFTPAFSDMFHEFLHLSEQIRGIKHTYQGALNPLDTDRNEQSAIYGKCGCHPETSRCQNGLLQQFWLWPRRFHYSCARPFSQAARIDAAVKSCLYVRPLSVRVDTSIPELMELTQRGFIRCSSGFFRFLDSSSFEQINRSDHLSWIQELIGCTNTAQQNLDKSTLSHGDSMQEIAKKENRDNSG